MEVSKIRKLAGPNTGRVRALRIVQLRPPAGNLWLEPIWSIYQGPSWVRLGPMFIHLGSIWDTCSGAIGPIGSMRGILETRLHNPNAGSKFLVQDPVSMIPMKDPRSMGRLQEPGPWDPFGAHFFGAYFIYLGPI